MLRAMIVDDEPRGRNVLRHMLSRYCVGVEVVGDAGSAEEARALLGQARPDLVFLDVEMPGENGFEFLESIGEAQFSVIFVTAHDEYALRAIKFSALDYLLKPIDPEELRQAVAKAERGRGHQQDRLLKLFEELRSVPTKVTLPTRQGHIFVDVAEIIRCEAQSNYTVVCLAGGARVTAARTLKEFEDLLPRQSFVRIHQSHLVNIQHVRRYIKGDGGSVVLSDGSEVEVSRRLKNQLFARLPRL